MSFYVRVFVKMNRPIPLLVIILALVSVPLSGCNTASVSDDPAQSQTRANGEPQTLITEPEVADSREDYDEVNLADLPPEVSLVGVDPAAVAAAVFMPPVSPEEAQEVVPVDTVTVTTLSNERVLVLQSRVGLLDDSVRGIRYRVEFLPVAGSDGSETSEWQMVWAGRQYLCQPRRGSQDWSSKLCS